MALGFRDCCNQYNYFYVSGIPATVSEFETYYIETTQGVNICATYVEVPVLNYLPPTYNLNQMTQYSSCDTCTQEYVCPTQESIFVPKYGAGVIATASDCELKTIFPLYVECRPTQPTISNETGGEISLYVNGGTVPYSFTNGDTLVAIQPIGLPDGSVYTLQTGLGSGTYNYIVNDLQSDYIVPISCVLSPPPAYLNANCNSTNVSIWGANDGVLNLNIDGGTSPYVVVLTGATQTLPIEGLTAGTYSFTVSDSGIGDNYQSLTVICTITQPDRIIYPEYLCLTTNICDTTFSLTFVSAGTQNYRALYNCINPTTVGLSTLLLYWDNGWRTSQEDVTSTPQWSTSCGLQMNLPIYFIQSSNSVQPTGLWSAYGAFTNAKNTQITEGSCPPALAIIAVNNACIPAKGSAIVSPSSGVPPYVFYYSSGTNTVGPVESTVINNLNSGTYSVYTVDSTGTESLPQTFVVENQNPITVTLNGDCPIIDSLVNSGGPNTIKNASCHVHSDITPSWTDADIYVLGRIKVIVLLETKLASNGLPSLGQMTYNLNPSGSTSTTNGITTGIFDNTTPTDTGWIAGSCTSSPACNCGNGGGNAGRIYTRTITYLSNLITINNGTEIYFDMVTSIQNKITTEGCAPYIKYTSTPSLVNLSVQQGCAFISPTNPMYNYYQKLTAGFVWNEFAEPQPACPQPLPPPQT